SPVEHDLSLERTIDGSRRSSRVSGSALGRGPMTQATAIRSQLAVPHRKIRETRAPMGFRPLATPPGAILYLGTMVPSLPIGLLRPLLVSIGIGLGLTLVVTAAV